jgi:WD40 repeat protein
MLTEDELLKYTGNNNSKFLVDISVFENNGRKYLLSGSEDDCIAIWDIERGGDCFKIPANTGGQNINSVAANRDGVIAYAGFPDTANMLHLTSLNIN